jgi:CheY-like chemotaxis protein
MLHPDDGQGARPPRTSRVLVGEDDEPLAMLIWTLLTGAQYRTEVASTGQAALDRLQADDVDLVQDQATSSGMTR